VSSKFSTKEPWNRAYAEAAAVAVARTVFPPTREARSPPPATYEAAKAEALIREGREKKGELEFSFHLQLCTP